MFLCVYQKSWKIKLGKWDRFMLTLISFSNKFVKHSSDNFFPAELTFKALYKVTLIPVPNDRKTCVLFLCL